MNENSGASAGPSAPGQKEQNAIYQNGKAVGHVENPEVDPDGKQILFEEIWDSDHLVLAEECEFQKYRIMIQKVAFATKVDRRPGREGRTLAGCTADILGYREQ